MSTRAHFCADLLRVRISAGAWDQTGLLAPRSGTGVGSVTHTPTLSAAGPCTAVFGIRQAEGVAVYANDTLVGGSTFKFE